MAPRWWSHPDVFPKPYSQVAQGIVLLPLVAPVMFPRPYRITICVLDVGCGSGSMSRLIARSFPEVEVVGVDVREQYLDYARARAREEGLHNLTFERGDVFALPFPDASFDLVWSKYLLQWLREPKTALAEFKRLVKPGGHVVSCDYVGCVVEHFPIDPELE